jgi:hypothetical protein
MNIFLNKSLNKNSYVRNVDIFGSDLTINLLAFYIILIASKATALPIGYSLFMISIIFIGNHLLKHRNVDKIVIYLSIIWMLINATHALVFSVKFDFLFNVRFILIYLILPSLILKTYGFDFLLRMEKIIFKLTLISLPLFLFNNIFNGFLSNFRNIFAPFTRDALLSNPGYWSIGIYTNIEATASIGQISVIRNAGFMWEPGYFALVLVFALLIHWKRQKMKVDIRATVYIVAVLTTFSTAGYFSIFLILISLFSKKINFFNAAFIIIISSIFVNNIYKTSFMKGKIDNYLIAVYDDKFNYAHQYEAIKLNRFQIALYDIDRIKNYPFGFGSNDRYNFGEVELLGTNGFTGLIRVWGIPVFLFFIYAIYKFVSINNQPLFKIQLFLHLFSLIVVLFSQNIQNNILFYFIVLYGYVYTANKEMALKFSNRKNF